MARTTVKEEIELDQEAIKVIEWRTDWLRAGGFTKRNARIIGEDTRIDWRYANEVRKNCVSKGFDEDFVMKLIL